MKVDKRALTIGICLLLGTTGTVLASGANRPTGDVLLVATDPATPSVAAGGFGAALSWGEPAERARPRSQERPLQTAHYTRHCGMCH